MKATTFVLLCTSSQDTVRDRTAVFLVLALQHVEWKQSKHEQSFQIYPQRRAFHWGRRRSGDVCSWQSSTDDNKHCGKHYWNGRDCPGCCMVSHRLNNSWISTFLSSTRQNIKLKHSRDKTQEQNWTVCQCQRRGRAETSCSTTIFILKIQLVSIQQHYCILKRCADYW